jgi:excisionase family DNA binding protein
MKGQEGMKETYLTIEEVAGYLKLAQQTIRKYVLNKRIPYRKVQKSVRFRLSEIERWIDGGGGNCPDYPADEREGELFACLDAPKAGETETGAGGAAGTDGGTGTGEKAGADGGTGAGGKAGVDGEAGTKRETGEGAE